MFPIDVLDDSSTPAFDLCSFVFVVDDTSSLRLHIVTRWLFIYIPRRLFTHQIPPLPSHYYWIPTSTTALLHLLANNEISFQSISPVCVCNPSIPLPMPVSIRNAVNGRSTRLLCLVSRLCVTMLMTMKVLSPPFSNWRIEFHPCSNPIRRSTLLLLLLIYSTIEFIYILVFFKFDGPIA